MRSKLFAIALCALFTILVPTLAAPQQDPPADDPVKTLVAHLDLETYKSTIKSLTQFGDRRQGTDRNRAAIDWIEAQLKSYGCTNTERLQYEYRQAATGQRGDAGNQPQRGGAQGRGGNQTA